MNGKILVAQHIPLMCKGICSAIEADDELSIFKCCNNCEDTYEKVLEMRPSVLLIDADLPNEGGISLSKKILEEISNISILIIVGQRANSISVIPLIRMGIMGCISRNISLENLINTIKFVQNGQIILESKFLGKELEDKFNGSQLLKSGNWSLGNRESQVLSLVAVGMTNREIAYKLRISERTVQAHCGNIFRKMGVHSRTEATFHAMKEGLIPA